MASRRIFLLILMFSAAGCGRGSAPAGDSGAGRLKTPADRLVPADLDRFLAIVQANGSAAIPEFTPPDEEPSLDYNRRADDLVSAIRGQFRRIFDAERQGRFWEADESWSHAFSRHDITGPEFAALVRSVGCAVMRVRLDTRVDVSRLLANARAEVQDLVATMDAIDEIPEADRTRLDATIRAQSALRLARGVALREFAEMVRQVPAENCALVRKYSEQIKPLLPADGADGLLSELQALGSARPDGVVPAGHAMPTGE